MFQTPTKLGQGNSLEVIQDVLAENIIRIFFVTGKYTEINTGIVTPAVPNRAL